MTSVESRAKLRAEVKEKWLAALRSGEYEQGIEYLHYRDGDSEFYCCLGVLCDLAVQEGVVLAREVTAVDGGEDEISCSGHGALVEYAGVSTLPPGVVNDWAYEVLPDPNDESWTVVRSEDDDPEYFWPRTYSLAELNDEHGLSFQEIADLIEEQL